MMQIENPISDSRRDEIIDKIARWFRRKRIEVPATVFMQVNKPLTFMASQGWLFSSHLAALFFKEKTINEVYQLLSDRENIDRVIDRIDYLAEEERQHLAKSKTKEKSVSCQS